MATSWRERALKSIDDKKTNTASTKGSMSWKEKAQKSLDNRGYVPEAPKKEIDWLSESGALKKELATALSGGAFDAEEMRPLVENYAVVQFKLFDENLKKGYAYIKPVGENLSNLFKAHGYDFNELYPDLAKDFSTGNIETYAYNASEAFKQKYDEKVYHDATKDALLDKAVATNEQREHERNAENIATDTREKTKLFYDELAKLGGDSAQNRQIVAQKIGFLPSSVGTTTTPEEAAERKAAKDAYARGVYADEALFATRTMLDVMSRPDFEEKSKYEFGSTPSVNPSTTGLDINFIGRDSFEEVEFDDGTTADIHARGFTEDQYKVYMYLLNTEGVEAATRFENGIKNTLNSMRAERASQIFQDMEKGNPLEKVASGIGQAGYAFASGVEGIGQAFKGIGDTFTGDTEYFMPGVAQQVTAKNKENTSSLLGKLSLGATEAIPQVLGTAALGTVNPVLGTVFLGGTAYGSSYVDAVNSGATRAQAIGMGVASAALEIALERYVGNTIEGFGPSLFERVGKGIKSTSLGKSVANTFTKFATSHPKGALAVSVFGKWLGNSSSEFVEEYLAETAAPLLRNIFIGENNDFTLWSDEQKEAGLIGFITGGILEGFRSTSAISDIMAGGYRLTHQRILNMSDSSVIAEYMNGISDAEIASMLSIEDPSFNNLDGQGMMDAIESARASMLSEITADEARSELLERERFISSTVAVSEYAKEGLSYDEAIKKAEKLGVDISGFEEFTKSAYDLGKAEARTADIEAEVQNLINQGESSIYIASVTGMSADDVNNAKARAFSESLAKTSMSDLDKAKAIREYTLKEQALDRMYRMGNSGLQFDASMSAGVISDADAYKAFTRGENAYKARQETKLTKQMDEAPTAPVMAEDAATFGDVKFEEANIEATPETATPESVMPEATTSEAEVINEDIIPENDTSGVISETESTSTTGSEVSVSSTKKTINSFGSNGTALYNRILDPVAKGTDTKANLQKYISGFAHVYEAGQKGVPYKRSMAGPLHIKEINAIYEAGKKDAAARANVKKKTDAKVIKDDNFKKAKVSKRTERMLSGVSKIIGRDIRFSDDVKGNAKIDFESGEIIISTKAKSGHTWAMFHEVYHALVIDSPAEAAILKKTVLDIAKKNKAAFKRLLDRYSSVYSSELYDENGNFRSDASEYITEEMVADLVGFTLSEPAILEKLTGQQRTVLQKFVDKLVSMFGDKNMKAAKEYLSNADGDIRAIFKDVAREADSIAEQFKAALDTSQKAEKNTVERDGVRSSKDITESITQEDITATQNVGVKSVNDFTSTDIVATESLARKYYKELREKSPFFRAWFGDWRSRDNTRKKVVNIDASKNDIPKGTYRNIDTKWNITVSSVGIGDTISHSGKEKLSVMALNNIDSIIENAVLLDSVVSTPGGKKGKNTLFMHKMYALTDIGGKKYIAKLTIEEYFDGNDTSKRFYNLREIKMSSALGGLSAESTASTMRISNDTIIVSDLFNLVKTYDKSFNPKPSSVVVDENGMPKKVYHSTDESFDAFDITKSRSWDGVPDYDLPGFYFAENYDTSAAYGDIVGEYYIKITKPYEGGLYDLKRERGTYRAAYDYLVSQGYDGVIVDEFGEGDYEYIVLKDVNIKSATDNIGTFDSSNANTKMSKELFPDDRTMSAEDIERDEIEQYIQQIKSSDDLSDADVQAIREEMKRNREEDRKALLAEITSRNLERWGADIGRVEDTPSMSVDEAIKKVKKSFGINITHGGDASVSGNKVGAYNESTKTIRTKFKNDLPSIAHALGYHIDESLKMVDSVIEQTAKVKELNGEGIGEYESELSNLSTREEAGTRGRVREGFAEFIRMYLTSKPLAMEAAPMFYSYFESQLATNEDLAKAVETSAEAISGYFAQSFDSRASSAVMTAEDWKQFNKPRGKEAAAKLRNWVSTHLVDRFYGIKKIEKQYGVFDLSTSKNAYVKATLSLQARGRAARLLEDGFYDAYGNKVGESYFDIISPLGANYSDKFKYFGDYLTYVHALEWLEPNDQTGKKTSSGKDIYKAKAKGKVFGDETLNDANELKKLISQYELTYPDFKSIANKIYKYQDNLMKYYLVPSGALSQDQAETFRAQYPHYVPFNRFNSVFGYATNSGKKGTQMFANLSNPIKKADGGNAPIRNPLESIINSTIAAVDFKMKNDTMLTLIEEFTGEGSLPGVMERIYSSKELKKLDEKGKNPFMSEVGPSVNEGQETAFNPTIDKEKGIVHVWVNGEKRFYQVYDRDLYNAVANLEVQNLRGFFKVFNSITNVLKVTMTMRNPLFGPGNFYRDFMTFHYNTSSNANILMQLGMYAGALKSIIVQDENFKFYRALGGMDSGRFTADMDVIKRTISRRNSEAISWRKMSFRDFGEKVKRNLFGLKFLWDKYFELNDVLETLPRLAEFKYTMKETKGDVNLAMYRSQDVTTNFSRSGSWGRNINAIFLFSNAELQGIDKMVRNYSEAAYTAKNKNGEPAKAKIAGKVLKTVGWSLFMTALSQFINRRDDEAKEEYARLSDFIKNNYDVFYMGDGYFVKLPKEQNLAIPRTFMQRIFDAIRGDGLDLAELGSYIWDGITPDFVPDIFDLGNAPHQILGNTPISVITDVAFNRDYKGDEIVPSYMTGAKYEKYNAYTSAFSVTFARELYKLTDGKVDVSPMALDHYFGAFGYYGSLATNLFPLASFEENGFFGSIKENWSDALGLKTKFKVDARYSTDLLDDFYEGRDLASERLGIDGSGENRLVNEKYQSMNSFISSFNKLSKNDGEEQQRLNRLMLQRILENFDEGAFTEGEQYIIKLFDATGNEKLFESSYPGGTLKGEQTKNKVKYKFEVSLDANTYAEFCNEIDVLREEARVFVKGLGLDNDVAAVVITSMYSNIEDEVKGRYLEEYGKCINGDAAYVHNAIDVSSIVEDKYGDLQKKMYNYNDPIDDIDGWGRPADYANLSVSEAKELGFYSQSDYDLVDAELERLNAATGEKTSPTVQTNSYGEKGVTYKMSNSEFNEAREIRGKYSFEAVYKLINSAKYKNMSDSQKVKAIKACYSDAQAYTKELMLDDVMQPDEVVYDDNFWANIDEMLEQ